MEIKVSGLSHFILNKDGKFKLKVRQLKIEIWHNFMSNYNIIFDKTNLMLKAAAQPWAQRYITTEAGGFFSFCSVLRDKLYLL